MFDSGYLLQSPSSVVLFSVLAFAALAHGVLGFGFPIISAMMTDIKSAVILTVFPNIAVNLFSIAAGGNWRSSLGRHWPVAVYVLVGAIAGTRMLLVANPELLKLLLAAMLIVYLQQARFRKMDWSFLRRYPRSASLFFGVSAGFLTGTVNVTVPPLVMYFGALGLEALPMTQILNLCFLVGKSTQVFTFAMSGQIGVATFIATVPLILVAVTALAAGMRIRSRLSADRYRGLLQQVLWLMTLVLLLQVGWHYGVRFFPGAQGHE